MVSKLPLLSLAEALNSVQKVFKRYFIGIMGIMGIIGGCAKPKKR